MDDSFFASPWNGRPVKKNFAKKNKQMDDSVSAFVNVCGWFVGMLYKQVSRAYLDEHVCD